MSDNVIIAIISGFFTLLNTVLVLTLKNKLEKYHKQVDGMKNELVEAVKGRGEAEGNLKGREEQAEENKR